jgi:hypothetical protein
MVYSAGINFLYAKANIPTEQEKAHDDPRILGPEQVDERCKRTEAPPPEGSRTPCGEEE